MAGTLLGLIGLAAVAVPVSAQAVGELPGQEVWLGDDLAVTYLARIEGDWLVVEARHEPGWHTYAMDNLERAAAATGRPDSEAELPTRIDPSSEIELQGPWRQSAPIDLSDPEIRWYTWGFEGRSFFAARVDRAGPPAARERSHDLAPAGPAAPLAGADAWVTVNAQACTDKLCAMVEDLRVPVVTSGAASIDPLKLLAVGVADDVPGETATVRQQLVEFGAWFQRALDVECSGRVPAARLVQIMTPGVDRPRQMNWVMALDADEDGFVAPGEVGVGLWTNLDYQVERRMVGDVDGDGLLSPREYALSVPDPGAETNTDGMSELQDRFFSDLDGNGDRLVSREEIERSYSRNYTSRHWAHMLAYHLGRADADGDGAVDPEELSRAVEEAGGSVAGPALEDWFKAVVPNTAVVPNAAESRLVLSESLTAALTEAGADAERRAALEAPLRSLLSPDCSAR